jgi:putative transposase
MISASDRQQAIELIDEAVAAGASLKRACETLGLCLRSYQRWTQGEHLKVDARPLALRPTPANQLSEEERQRILAICNQAEYQSLPPSQIVPDLADKGLYLASESSFYRILREANQNQRRGKQRPPRHRARPTPYSASAPNQVWSWDITSMHTTIAGSYYRLYLVLDVYSRKIVGWEVHEQETTELASLLMRNACLAEGITESGLVLHADNGSAMKGSTMLATLQRLGIIPSFSRPSVSNDNPYSESLFGTMKYRPGYPSQPFDSLTAARTWVYGFVHWYNHEHRHSSIRFVTPHERHQGLDKQILAQRKRVYEQARQQHPERWAGDTRNWSPIEEVWLNPEN